VKPSNELAILAPDETVSFTLEASPGDTAGLTCKIVDWDGKAIPIPEGKEAKKASLPPGSLENGYYELIVLRYGAEVSRKSFAVIPKPDANIDPSKNQFGAMVIPHTAYPLADRETDAKFMERIGIRWVRTHRLNWIHVQKAPDKPFDWREADAEMEIYKRHKLDVVATCGWPCPPWASSGNPHGVIGAARGNMTPEAKFQPQLERFYTELAKRYAGRVAYYEIGNEVDANNFWLGSYESWASGSKDAIMKDYCKYFLLCAKALKAGDPEAKVAPNTTGAAEGHSYKPWLETMCKEGIGEEMNSFSTHYMADLPAIRKTLAKYGKGDIDIILTEIGGFVRSEREKLSPAELESSIRTSYTHFAAN
jgi:GH35 family endo-1,4-beta-xylanase